MNNSRKLNATINSVLPIPIGQNRYEGACFAITTKNRITANTVSGENVRVQTTTARTNALMPCRRFQCLR